MCDKSHVSSSDSKAHCMPCVYRQHSCRNCVHIQLHSLICMAGRSVFFPSQCQFGVIFCTGKYKAYENLYQKAHAFCLADPYISFNIRWWQEQYKHDKNTINKRREKAPFLFTVLQHAHCAPLTRAVHTKCPPFQRTGECSTAVVCEAHIWKRKRSVALGM